MPVDRYQNSTAYEHPQESNLLNIHKTMQYNSQGQPVARVHVDGITLEGDVLVDTVSLSSSTLAALESISVRQEGTWTVSIGTNGQVVVSNFTSTVNIASLPAITGTVAVSNFPTSVTVTNFTSTVNIASMPAVSGTVVISSLPAVTGTVTVNGSVTVTNFTSTVNVASLPAITGTVITSNFTSTVNIASMPAVSGTVAVSSLPAITGTVVVSNFTSTVFVSNTLTISNTSFAVTNFPTTSTVFQGTSPWTITGTVVASNFTSTVNVANTVTVNQGTNPWTVTGNINATIDGEVSVAGMNPDAFGRQRVSELFTLGDYKHLYAIDPNFLDSTASGATVTFVPDQAAAVLATSSNTGSYAIHQTKFYHHYQPGKSQLIYTSMNFRAPNRNVTKRTGYFDDRDGIYFEQVGSDTADGTTVSTSTQTLNWVIRTYVGGSASEATFNTTVNGLAYVYKRRVPQSEWNIDKCDGTGASGFKLDITKTHLCWIDFQWLGVGRVRCGFVHNGALITAHEYYHSNILPTVYMSNPNLPVRCEIRNTGTTPGGAFDQICSSVMSEGGYTESGIDWSIATTPRTTPTPGQTRFPLLAIRLKNAFQGYPNRLSVRPNSLGLYAETNSILYEVVKFPSAASLSTTDVGGLVWTSADSNSGVEYCVNATSFISANGDRFASGYVPSGSSQNSLSPVASGTLTAAKKNIISQNINSTDSEVYVIVVSTINAGNNIIAHVAATIQWREIY